MTLKEIMRKAHQAQIKAGKCIPVQLKLFGPTHVTAWDDRKEKQCR